MSGTRATKLISTYGVRARFKRALKGTGKSLQCTRRNNIVPVYALVDDATGQPTTGQMSLEKIARDLGILLPHESITPVVAAPKVIAEATLLRRLRRILQAKGHKLRTADTSPRYILILADGEVRTCGDDLSKLALAVNALRQTETIVPDEPYHELKRRLRPWLAEQGWTLSNRGSHIHPAYVVADADGKAVMAAGRLSTIALRAKIDVSDLEGIRYAQVQDL